MLGHVSTSERQPSEEELRAAYEAELKRLRVEQVLLEGIVSLINLGMRRTGLAPGTEDERDPEQVRLAIEGVRMHLPLVESVAPQQPTNLAGLFRRVHLSQYLLLILGGEPAPFRASHHLRIRTGRGAPSRNVTQGIQCVRCRNRGGPSRTVCRYHAKSSLSRPAH